MFTESEKFKLLAALIGMLPPVKTRADMWRRQQLLANVERYRAGLPALTE